MVEARHSPDPLRTGIRSYLRPRWPEELPVTSLGCPYRGELSELPGGRDCPNQDSVALSLPHLGQSVARFVRTMVRGWRNRYGSWRLKAQCLALCEMRSTIDRSPPVCDHLLPDAPKLVFQVEGGDTARVFPKHASTSQFGCKEPPSSGSCPKMGSMLVCGGSQELRLVPGSRFRCRRRDGAAKPGPECVAVGAVTSKSAFSKRGLAFAAGTQG